jgi:predicted secreted protein
MKQSMVFTMMVLWMVSLIFAGTKEETMAVFPMSDKDDTCIQVQPGQIFSLKFVTNPGTGYGWELAEPLDNKTLTIMETKIETPGSGLFGANENEIWICRALTSGQTEIALKYVRPWDKDTVSAKKHVFKVKIQ